MRMLRVAAVQMEAVLADVDANLEQCERLADAAAAQGAQAIGLPEFFTTGIGFVPELAERALAPDGAATDLLLELARRHGALVGGSFLCRDPDGHVRNAYLLAGPDGILGRHDKDLPTMWENAFYVGGLDPGTIEADGMTVGAAVCWELMRTQTVHRLRGRIDLAMTGSGWWSIPYAPWLEAGNERRAHRAAATFARFVGAPVLHAAHAGPISCPWPWMPGIPYDGHFEGATLITDATGRILAERSWREGAGVVVADVEPGRIAPLDQPPARFWLHDRGSVGAFAWWFQRLHGRRWYERHTRREPERAQAQPPAMAGRMTSTSESPTEVSSPSSTRTSSSLR
jgi:predicted amidohydrolase